MPTTTLHFVRHGETDYNRQRIVQGRGINASLNATGRAQAVAIAQRLADVPLDVIYASTLRRAIETAEKIAAVQGSVPVHQLDDLEEMAWGIYEGQPASPETNAAFADMNARWRRGEFGFRVEGGESILDVQARGQRAVAHILEQHPGETVLVVTHGRFLRVMLSTLLDAYGLERMHDIPHSNTALNTLTCRDGCFEAERINCTAHLGQTASSDIDYA
jgi:broad specificity phosphatase PhoE